MDITLNQNGSGTLALEYQISASLDSLGKLDGNERWNTIPLGKADFERTLDRLPGMKLLSHTSREHGKNLVINAKMEFTDLSVLIAFLDAGGLRSSFTGDGSSGRITLTLSEGAEIRNPHLDRLIADVSDSYSVMISMTFPKEGSLNIADIKGQPLNAVPGSDIKPNGKKVSLLFPLYGILSASRGIIAELRW